MADLIDRKDAMNAIKPIYGWSIAAGEELEAAIAALPAQGVNAPALEACRIIDEVVKEGHDNVGEMILHFLTAAEPAREALRLAALEPAEAGGVESRTLPMPAPPVDVTFFRDGSIWVKPVSDAEAASPGVEPPQPGEASASGTPAPAPVDALVKAAETFSDAYRTWSLIRRDGPGEALAFEQMHRLKVDLDAALAAHRGEAK